MECSVLCRLFFELRLVEIIKFINMFSFETEKVFIRYIRKFFVNELVLGVEFWDVDKIVCEFKRFYS